MRYILDTNAVIALLNGNRGLAVRLEHAEYVGISVITYLEFLAFDGLTDTERYSFNAFTSRVEVIPLLPDEDMVDAIFMLRVKHRLKLPDAIIGATAICRSCVVITDDLQFHGIPDLIVQGCS